MPVSQWNGPQRQPVRIFRFTLLIAVSILIGFCVHLGLSRDAGTEGERPNYGTGICADAGGRTLDVSGFHKRTLVIPLREGCFSYQVILPDHWSTWSYRRAPGTTGGWVARWEKQPGEPESLDANRDFERSSSGKFLRLQGSGSVLFYASNCGARDCGPDDFSPVDFDGRDESFRARAIPGEAMGSLDPAPPKLRPFAPLDDVAVPVYKARAVHDDFHNRVCPQAVTAESEVHIDGAHNDRFTTQLVPGCFSAVVYVPSEWQRWSLQMAGSGWAAYMLGAYGRAAEVRNALGMRYLEWNPETSRVRVQGDGLLTFYSLKAN